MMQAALPFTLLALGILQLRQQAAAATTTHAFCGVPLQKGTRTSSAAAIERQAWQRPVRVRPLIRGTCRRGPKKGSAEDFEQLDEIPGMSETVGIPLQNVNNTSMFATDWLLWPTTKTGSSGTRSGVYSNSPTGGYVNVAAPNPPDLLMYTVEREAVDSAADSGVAPENHATTVAKGIAQKIAEGSISMDQLQGSTIEGGSTGQSSSSDFRTSAVKSMTEYVQPRERRAAATLSSKAPAGIDVTRVPNLWLAVAHSSSLKIGKVKKVEVDGVPIALWRSTTGAVSALSDVCIHRGASLSRGWIASDRLVCPYHGFEFEADGCLAHMPAEKIPAAAAVVPSRGRFASARGGRKAPTYKVKEIGGWIHIFPDETRPGSVDQHRDPLVIPEALSPDFRAIQGSMEIEGDVSTCVENMLDMLHISFVHSFGNMQDPAPFEVSYKKGFEDPGRETVATSQVTFRYRSGSRSFSKVIGKSTEVVVKNEFLLPYRAVIRVFFGDNSVKSIEATAVPKGDGKTALHWKLYRNFAISHPKDEGPINKAADFFFKEMMDLTLREDKKIIESVYSEYQSGFMNSPYDKQVLRYREAIANFQAAATENANTQVETSLQMELLNRISCSQRGLASTRKDRANILDLIQRLESVQATTATPPPPPPTRTPAAAATTVPASSTSPSRDAQATNTSLFFSLAPETADRRKNSAAVAFAAKTTAADTEATKARGLDGKLSSTRQDSVEGEWHLEYMSNEENGVVGWDFEGSTDSEKMERVAALKGAGGEAHLFDWNEIGRPLWADTTESVQIIDIKARTLTNRAVYKGWGGLTTTVELDACIEPLHDQASRFEVGFRKAIVNVGGIKVIFPHLQRFTQTGWMETTYVKQGIRIARGNKGSIFVLTRQPVSSFSSSSSSSSSSPSSSSSSSSPSSPSSSSPGTFQ